MRSSKRTSARSSFRLLTSVFPSPILEDVVCSRSSLQYKGWDADAAVQDYWERIRYQEKTYEPIIDPDVAWIKVVNVGERIVINRIEGEQ